MKHFAVHTYILYIYVTGTAVRTQQCGHEGATVRSPRIVYAGAASSWKFEKTV